MSTTTSPAPGNAPATTTTSTTLGTEESSTTTLQQKQHHLHLLPPSILSPTAPATFPADFDFASLTGQWYVVHTSSPIWRDKRNVVINYTPLSALPSLPSAAAGDKTATAPAWPVLDDRVTWQTLTADKTESLPGTDTPQSPSPAPPSASSSATATSSGFSLGGWARRAAAAAAPTPPPPSSADSPAPGGEGAGGAPRVWQWRGTGLYKLITSRWEIIGYGPPLADADRGKDGAGQQRAWMVVFALKTMFSPNIINICTRDKRGVGPEVLEEVKRVLTAWARGSSGGGSGGLGEGEGGGPTTGGKGLDVLEACVRDLYDVRHD